MKPEIDYDLLAKAIVKELFRVLATVAPAAVEAAEPVTPEPPRMRPADYARTRGYSARTVSRMCAAGLPCVGRGKIRRILVAPADTWLAAGGARGAARRTGAAAQRKGGA